MNRRHFLINAGALLGACLLPGAVLRRATDHLAATNQPLIEPPARPRWTLFATEVAIHRWQLSRGEPTTAPPEAPPWREWLGAHRTLDLRKTRELARVLGEDGYEEVLARPGWLDTPIPDPLWETYIDGRFAVHESPEARALSYLERLNLRTHPMTDTDGNPVGTVEFYHGTAPGVDWHFVEVEGALILPALQHRLRELGERVEVRIHG